MERRVETAARCFWRMQKGKRGKWKTSLHLRMRAPNVAGISMFLEGLCLARGPGRRQGLMMCMREVERELTVGFVGGCVNCDAEALGDTGALKRGELMFGAGEAGAAGVEV